MDVPMASLARPGRNPVMNVSLATWGGLVGGRGAGGPWPEGGAGGSGGEGAGESTARALRRRAGRTCSRRVLGCLYDEDRDRLPVLGDAVEGAPEAWGGLFGASASTGRPAWGRCWWVPAAEPRAVTAGGRPVMEIAGMPHGLIRWTFRRGDQIAACLEALERVCVSAVCLEHEYVTAARLEVLEYEQVYAVDDDGERCLQSASVASRSVPSRSPATSLTWPGLKQGKMRRRTASAPVPACPRTRTKESAATWAGSPRPSDSLVMTDAGSTQEATCNCRIPRCWAAAAGKAGRPATAEAVTRNPTGQHSDQ